MRFLLAACLAAIALSAAEIPKDTHVLLKMVNSISTRTASASSPSCSCSRSRVARLREPSRRPAGLPDCPGANYLLQAEEAAIKIGLPVRLTSDSSAARCVTSSPVS